MQVISVTSVNTGIKYWIMILLDCFIYVNCSPPPPPHCRVNHWENATIITHVYRFHSTNCSIFFYAELLPSSFFLSSCISHQYPFVTDTYLHLFLGVLIFQSLSWALSFLINTVLHIPIVFYTCPDHAIPGSLTWSRFYSFHSWFCHNFISLERATPHYHYARQLALFVQLEDIYVNFACHLTYICIYW